mmetsp:Transcript_49404/g.132192  ORF Transcript_49404/g.132192 Transcript_49404/m.132192 type:complete len:248 (+) Transcript_49404:69-812(+)
MHAASQQVSGAAHRMMGSSAEETASTSASWAFRSRAAKASDLTLSSCRRLASLAASRAALRTLSSSLAACKASLASRFLSAIVATADRARRSASFALPQSRLTSASLSVNSCKCSFRQPSAHASAASLSRLLRSGSARRAGSTKRWWLAVRVSASFAAWSPFSTSFSMRFASTAFFGAPLASSLPKSSRACVAWRLSWVEEDSRCATERISAVASLSAAFASDRLCSCRDTASRHLHTCLSRAAASL